MRSNRRRFVVAEDLRKRHLRAAEHRECVAADTPVVRRVRAAAATCQRQTFVCPPPRASLVAFSRRDGSRTRYSQIRSLVLYR